MSGRPPRVYELYRAGFRLSCRTATHSCWRNVEVLHVGAYSVCQAHQQLATRDTRRAARPPWFTQEGVGPISLYNLPYENRLGGDPTAGACFSNWGLANLKWGLAPLKWGRRCAKNEVCP